MDLWYLILYIEDSNSCQAAISIWCDPEYDPLPGTVRLKLETLAQEYQKVLELVLKL